MTPTAQCLKATSYHGDGGIVSYNPRIAAVFDGDNLFRHWARGQIQPCVPALTEALRNRGVQSTTVVRNFFRREERLRWRGAGVETKSVNRNCDRDAMLVAIEYVMRGLDTLILGTGDSDFLPLVNATRHAGTSVELWTKQRSVSRKLLSVADSVRFIDDLIEQNTDRDEHVWFRAPRQPHFQLSQSIH